MSETIYRVLSKGIEVVAPLLIRLLVPGSPEERRERLGKSAPLPGQDSEGGWIWIHAASAGEMGGAAPVVREIQQRRPGRPIVLTAMTRAGRARAGRIAHIDARFAPLDLPGALHRFFSAYRPGLLILMETEIWPNLLYEAEVHNCPAAVLNGRISRRGASRMRFARPLYRSGFGRLALCGVQKEIDRERFLSFGARPETLFVHGNTKVDAVPPGKGELPLKKNSGDRWVVFGSVRPQEEEAVGQAIRTLLDTRTDTRIALVPRHPKRAGTISIGPERSWHKWSSRRDPQNARAIEVDTIGDLIAFYRIADVAFVGGSLSHHGGHNPLEPAQFGVPVLFGPHLDNCREHADLLLDAGGAAVVTSGDDLARQIKDLLDSDSAREKRGKRAAQAVRSARGATRRAVDRLEASGLLGPGPGLKAGGGSSQ